MAIPVNLDWHAEAARIPAWRRNRPHRLSVQEKHAIAMAASQPRPILNPAITHEPNEEAILASANTEEEILAALAALG